ncbi:MAG: peptidoglycan bridge formation glycyltransferase FemA/FemB family protein [Actinomycetes bacterium]
MPTPLTVRPIAHDEHLAFVVDASGSFLQTPAWGEVKADWRHESIGWFDGDHLVGAALVLYRRTPLIERYFAYLPEGPVIDWRRHGAEAVTKPLLTHLKRSKAFTAKIGPQLVTRRWSATSVKDAIAAGTTRLGDVSPDVTDADAMNVGAELKVLGWRRNDAGGAGFGDLQPRYVFQVPLVGRSTDDLFSGFNQLWRRNVRKAEKSGVTVELGGFDDLAAFHAVYAVTALRDGFTARPLRYFQQMWRSMNAEDDDRIRLYLARHEGEVLAATTWVRVGDHVWYSYGASADHKRELRPSNAVQWRMLVDAHAAGAAVYDLRGISDTLREDDPLFGLIRFKLGTGGEAVEYLGEWDFPINGPLHKAFELYLARR